MRGLERIVANRAARSQPYMYDRRVVFEFVVAVMVKSVGQTDGQSGSAGFHKGEGGMIVHQIIGEQLFLPPAATKIQGGKIVEGAASGHSGEGPIVLFVPEVVRVVRRRFRGGWRRRGNWRSRRGCRGGFLRRNNLGTDDSEESDNNYTKRSLENPEFHVGRTRPSLRKRCRLRKYSRR